MLFQGAKEGPRVQFLCGVEGLKIFADNRCSFWLFFGYFRGSYRLKSPISQLVTTSKASSFEVLPSDCYCRSLRQGFPLYWFQEEWYFNL